VREGKQAVIEPANSSRIEWGEKTGGTYAREGGLACSQKNRERGRTAVCSTKRAAGGKNLNSAAKGGTCEGTNGGLCTAERGLPAANRETLHEECKVIRGGLIIGLRVSEGTRERWELVPIQKGKSVREREGWTGRMRRGRQHPEALYWGGGKQLSSVKA